MKEAKVNVIKKFGDKHIPALYELFTVLYKVDSYSLLTSENIATFEPVIARKDIPILVSALRMNANFLVTLDKKDFMSEKIRHVTLPFEILLPGTYIQKYVR